MLGKRTLRDALGLTMFILTGAAGGAAQSSAANRPPKTTIMFPLDEVHAGLRGVAYTVFEGVRPEAMDVEILGRLRNALGPGRDMILARLHGTKPEYTGVVAGMSGSPVYVDGKLLGALSYRIGQFSKEPIAGITPIAQMLEVRDETPALRSSGSASAETTPDIRPIESLLVFGGFGQEAIARFGDPFKTMGLVPVNGLGGMDAGSVQPEPLEPGSAVSALLVTGDLSVTGTCTVSYLDATRLLACGHPITQSGQVEMPMAKAEVLATLASPLNSFKIVNATEVVGAFTEDRASAISGALGARARMIPVTVNIKAEGAGSLGKTYHFSVVNHRELTPQLLLVSVYQTLQQTLSGATETSYKLCGELQLARRADNGGPGEVLPAVALEGWEAQSDFNPGAINATLAVGLRFQELFANAQEQPVVTGVQIEVETSARRRTATLEGARLSMPEASAGQTIMVEAEVHPYQRPARTLRLPLTLPDSVEPGQVRVLVSDGPTLDRLLDAPGTHPSPLLDTVKRMNALHANDRVYVTLLDRNAQAVLDSGSLREVPLSVANVLEPLKGAQRLRLTGESVRELGSVPVDDALTGSQVLTMLVH